MSEALPAPEVPVVKPRPVLFWTLLGVYVVALAAIAWMWWTQPGRAAGDTSDAGPVIRLTVPDAAP